MQPVEQLLTNPKASATAAAATMGSGVAGWLHIFTPNVTLIATVSGILLTWTMIFFHIKKMRREDREYAEKARRDEAEHFRFMQKVDLEIQQTQLALEQAKAKQTQPEA